MLSVDEQLSVRYVGILIFLIHVIVHFVFCLLECWTRKISERFHFAPFRLYNLARMNILEITFFYERESILLVLRYMVQNSIYVYVEIRVAGCTSFLRSNQLFSPLYPISFSPLQCALFFMGTIVICWNRQGCLILLSAELPSLVWERIGGPCAYCLGLVVSILGPNNAAHVSLQVLYCLIE